MVDTIEVETVSIEMDGVTKEVEVKKPRKKAAEAKPEPKPRTCEIARVLPVSVVQLIKAAPHNDTVRAVILAHLKQPVPPECKTFEDIKEWVETTIVFNPPKLKSAVEGYAEIPITGTRREHGRVNYSCDQRGRGNAQIPLHRFIEIVNEVDDMDDLMAEISDRIGENWEDYVNFDEVNGSHDYHDYETDEDEPYTDGDWDYQDGHRQHIKELIRQHVPERLGLFNNE